MSRRSWFILIALYLLSTVAGAVLKIMHLAEPLPELLLGFSFGLLGVMAFRLIRQVFGKQS